MDQRRSDRRFITGARPRLVLGGLAAAAGMTLSGCGSSDVQPAEFTTVAECTSAGFDQQLCDAGYNAAYQEHQRSAPRFADRRACESEWGDTCTPLSGPASASSSGSVFVPLLAGFVLSQALQQRYYDTGEIDIDYYGRGRYRGSPIYRSRTGNTVTLDRSGGVTKSTPVNVNTRTAAVSGFGGRGMSRGGGFGG